MDVQTLSFVVENLKPIHPTLIDKTFSIRFQFGSDLQQSRFKKATLDDEIDFSDELFSFDNNQKDVNIVQLSIYYFNNSTQSNVSFWETSIYLEKLYAFKNKKVQFEIPVDKLVPQSRIRVFALLTDLHNSSSNLLSVLFVY
jgi:hypothetical protein